MMRMVTTKTEELLRAAERSKADSVQSKDVAIEALLQEQRQYNHEVASRLKALGYKRRRGRHVTGSSGKICRKCGQPGHNARSCGRKPKE